jgi:hypothetical protein
MKEQVQAIVNYCKTIVLERKRWIFFSLVLIAFSFIDYKLSNVIIGLYFKISYPGAIDTAMKFIDSFTEYCTFLGISGKRWIAIVFLIHPILLLYLLTEDKAKLTSYRNILKYNLKTSGWIALGSLLFGLVLLLLIAGLIIALSYLFLIFIVFFYMPYLCWSAMWILNSIVESGTELETINTLLITYNSEVVGILMLNFIVLISLVLTPCSLYVCFAKRPFDFLYSKSILGFDIPRNLIWRLNKSILIRSLFTLYLQSPLIIWLVPSLYLLQLSNSNSLMEDSNIGLNICAAIVGVSFSAVYGIYLVLKSYRDDS